MHDITRRQELVASRVDAGDSLEQLERELIDAAPELDGEQRDALWMFAWSYRGDRIIPREDRPRRRETLHV